MATRDWLESDDGMLCLRDRVQGGVGGWLDEEEDGWRAEVGESYYLDMLRDDARNKAYRDGIERAVERINTDRGVSSVLDIGTGSGLLAMMAKRAGILSLSFPSPPRPSAYPTHFLARFLSLPPLSSSCSPSVMSRSFPPLVRLPLPLPTLIINSLEQRRVCSILGADASLQVQPM